MEPSRSNPRLASQGAKLRQRGGERKKGKREEPSVAACVCNPGVEEQRQVDS